MFAVIGPRIVKTTFVPSADASTSFTSHVVLAGLVAAVVMRLVMFVSFALGEALARMYKSADANATRIMRTSSAPAVILATVGMVRLT